MKLSAQIGLIASVVTIFIFLTGITSIFDFSGKTEATQNSPKDGTIEINDRMLGFDNTTVYLYKDGKKTILLDNYRHVVGAFYSDNKEKFALISQKNLQINPVFIFIHKIHLFNIDGSNQQVIDLPLVKYEGVTGLVLNSIVWNGNNRIRIYLSDDICDPQGKFNQFKIDSCGTYELLIDKLNTLIGIEKIV